MGKSLKQYMRNLYNRIYPNFYLKVLEKEISGMSVLDVGCGKNSSLQRIKKRGYSVGVDIFAPAIKESKSKKIHDEYILMDIRKLLTRIKPKSFDVVLASDVIEHFDKKDALYLLESFEKIARKKIIIFTPNGFVPQTNFDDNNAQEHKSGWDVDEMEKMGYAVFGIHGAKFLRGEFARMKYRPIYFSSIISDITQFITFKKPRYAFHLLCVKTIK